MPNSKITKRGQTTIPEQVRTDLLISAGDRVEWVKNAAGRCEVIPLKVDASQVAGQFKSWVKKLLLWMQCAMRFAKHQLKNILQIYKLHRRLWVK